MSVFRKRRTGTGNHAGLTLQRYGRNTRCIATPLNGLIPRSRVLSRVKQLLRDAFYGTIEQSGIYEFCCHYWGTSASKNKKRGMTWLWTAFRKFVLYEYFRDVKRVCQPHPYEHICWSIWYWNRRAKNDDEVMTETFQLSTNILPGLTNKYLLFPRSPYASQIGVGVGHILPTMTVTWHHIGKTSTLAGQDKYYETRYVGRALVIGRWYFRLDGVYKWRWLVGFCTGKGYTQRSRYKKTDYETGIPEWGATPDDIQVAQWKNVGLYYAVMTARNEYADMDGPTPGDPFRLSLINDCVIGSLYPDSYIESDDWFVLGDSMLPQVGDIEGFLDLRHDPIYLAITPRYGDWWNGRESTSNALGSGGCLFQLDYLPKAGRYCCYGAYEKVTPTWEYITGGDCLVGCHGRGNWIIEASGEGHYVNEDGTINQGVTWSKGEVRGNVSNHMPGHALF